MGRKQQILAVAAAVVLVVMGWIVMRPPRRVLRTVLPDTARGDLAPLESSSKQIGAALAQMECCTPAAGTIRSMIHGLQQA